METAQLDVINQSNDAGNSEIVVFQKDAVTPAVAASASRRIQLRLINRSNDVNNSEILIFQKNVASSVDELAVAWTVIENLGQGWTHSFTYSLEVTIGASDSYGNDSPQQAAPPGELWHVVQGTSGARLEPAGAASSPTEIGLRNDLSSGAINANIYRDGRLTASRTSIAPGQKAVFEFKPAIFIGIASQVEQGQIVDSAILSDINTEISLLGITSADIIMTGGGAGRTAEPFQFSLENIVMA